MLDFARGTYSQGLITECLSPALPVEAPNAFNWIRHRKLKIMFGRKRESVQLAVLCRNLKCTHVGMDREIHHSAKVSFLGSRLRVRLILSPTTRGWGVSKCLQFYLIEIQKRERNCSSKRVRQLRLQQTRKYVKCPHQQSHAHTRTYVYFTSICAVLMRWSASMRQRMSQKFKNEK